MAYDFPASPTPGQIFTPAGIGGRTYVWDGVTWRISGAGLTTSVFIADSPPNGVPAGSLWWESDTGNSFIAYQDQDATAPAWVQFNVSTVIADHISSASTDMYAGFTTTGGNYFRVNNKADGSGNDVLTLDEYGNLSANANLNSTTGSFITSGIAALGNYSLITNGYYDFGNGSYLSQIWTANPNFGSMGMDCIHVSGAYAGVRILPAGGVSFDFRTDGQAYKAGGGPWAALSDSRIKDVQGDYENGLAAVLALHPVIYRYKSQQVQEPVIEGVDPMRNANDRDFIGLIAQEAEIPMPEMVTQTVGLVDGERVDDLRQMDTGPLLFALINAVKELTARIEALEGGA
jgi:hypothetical protein